MTEQRCGTCRWWEDVGEGEPAGWGICERIQSGDPWSGDPAWVWDSNLGTRAGFGCVLWEPHDTEEPT